MLFCKIITTTHELIKKPLLDLEHATEKALWLLYTLGYRIVKPDISLRAGVLHYWEVLPPNQENPGTIKFMKNTDKADDYSVYLYPNLPMHKHFGEALFLYCLSQEQQLHNTLIRLECASVNSFRMCQRLQQYAGVELCMANGDTPELWLYSESLLWPYEEYWDAFSPYQGTVIMGRVPQLDLVLPQDFLSVSLP